MKCLEHSVIRIGTFTSVSRNILPQLMKNFKSLYPTVNFVLKQGEYTSIKKWILHGEIDFGFVNSDVVSGINMEFLYSDEMMAVLPIHHKLDNLVVIYYSNNITIEGECEVALSENLQLRFESQGWDVLQIDGHNFMQIDAALTQAKTSNKPVLIIAKTPIAKGSLH